MAEAVARLSLSHAVITSVDRDDLPDGGAAHFAQVIEAVRAKTSTCAVEVLTPDFRRKSGALDRVLDARPEVFAHNVETVPRLYKKARPGSDYAGSVGLLREAALRRDRERSALRVKSSIIDSCAELTAIPSDSMNALEPTAISTPSTTPVMPRPVTSTARSTARPS